MLPKIPDIYRQRDRRGFHTAKHIKSMFDMLTSYELDRFRASLSVPDFKALTMAIAYHDIVYTPGDVNNEKASIYKYLECPDHINYESNLVKRLIMITKNPSEARLVTERMMVALDHLIFFTEYREDIHTYCDQIFYEYQGFPYEDHYLPKRIKVLEDIQTYLPKVIEPLIKQNFLPGSCTDKIIANTEIAIAYEKARNPKIGLYVGSFNPFHIGHMDILEKAERIFDKVIVLQLFPSDKSPEMLPQAIHNRQLVTIQSNKTILEILRKLEYTEHTLIRGIRSGHDLLDEQNYLQAIRGLGVENPVVHILSSPHLQHVSSTLVRSLQELEGNHANRYIV